MHKLLIRFKIVKLDRIIETYLDERLSFKDNLVLLSDLLDIDIKDCVVYDNNKKIFLKMDVPIREFTINYFVYFYLF